MAHRQTRNQLAVAALAAVIALTAITAAIGYGAVMSWVTGRVEVAYADTFSETGDELGAVEYRTLDAGSLRYPLSGRLAQQLEPNALVSVRGEANGDAFVVRDSVNVSSSSTSTAGTSNAVPSNPRLAVMLANFDSDTRQTTTRESAASTIFGAQSAAAYWREVSNGQLSLSGDVFGYFTLDVPRSTCDYNSWMTAAKSEAASRGISLAGYTNYMLVFPFQNACGWGGVGNVGGSNTWVNGTLTTYVATHELGHNFGVHHATSLSCTDSRGTRVSFSDDCTSNEYGDPYDVMGTGLSHTSNWHRRELGFLDSSDQLTITRSGTYTVAPAAVAGGTPRVVRVARPDGDFFYLESRTTYGHFDAFSATSPAVNGLIIRLAPDGGAARSKLIDTTPGTTSFTDAPLPPGRTFSDPTSRLTIATVAVDDRGVTVRVAFGTSEPDPSPTATATPKPTASATPKPTATPTPTASPTPRPSSTPTPSTSPTPTPTATPTSSPGLVSPDTVRPSTPRDLRGWTTGKRVTLRWSASTDNKAVVGYRIYRNDQYVRTTPYLVRRLWQPAGIYTFYVRAVDAAGNVSRRSNKVTFTVLGT
jgi:hypothetical protein